MIWFWIGFTVCTWLTMGLAVLYTLPDYQKKRESWQTWFTWVVADRILPVLLWPFVIAYVEHTPLAKWKENRGSNREAQADRGDPQDSPGRTAGADAGEGAGEGASEDVVETIVPPGMRLITWEGEPCLVEEAKEDMPVLAHRWAYLRRDEKHEWGLYALNNSHGKLEMDADAVCHRITMHQQRMARGLFGSGFATTASGFATTAIETMSSSPHKAPDPECSCGFYAVPSDVLGKHVQTGAVELEVQLSGTVIHHEDGYRAEHQTILGWKPPICQFCPSRADHLFTVVGMDADGDAQGFETWICNDCGSKVKTFGTGFAVAHPVDTITKALGLAVKS